MGKHIINVRPLTTPEEIEDFRWALKYTGKERDLMLFNIGINLGLRVGDIVRLQVKDLRGKQHLLIVEQKTQKQKRLRIPKDLRDMIDNYTRTMTPDDYLFPSQMTDSHITSTQAYRILQKAAVVLERDDIGTHTMRKTFGYMHYRRYKDVALLQNIFNHSSPAITLRYIGVTQEEMDDSMEEFSL